MSKETFGQALRAARVARGLTQTDLVVRLRAQGLRTDPARVSDWELNRRVPEGRAVGALVRELGLPIEVLALLGGGPGAEETAEGPD